MKQQQENHHLQQQRHQHQHQHTKEQEVAKARAVKGIVNSKGADSDGTLMFKVRWEGCGKNEDVWLPATDVAITIAHRERFMAMKGKKAE